MPTYDYCCLTCGHQFENFQPMTSKPLKKCPKCGKKVERLIGGGAGIVFKGSGFYQTDYRSSNYKEGAKKESPPKGDSKPDTPVKKPDSGTSPKKENKK